MALEWRGPQVQAKVIAAAKQGVNQTMSECCVHAKNNHPWRNRTGVLEGSIRPVVAAHERGGEIVGVWGSADVMYAIFLELGTSRMPARPYLRPAADFIYPRLARNIQEALS